MLLAIDTSAGASVAVVDAGCVLGHADEFDTRSHAEAIGRLIRESLSQAGASPEEITGVVAGMGPGPFTGLRVGIAAAYAFASARGVSLLPARSHDAVAWDQATPCLVVTDARRREVAWSAYDGLDADGVPVLVTGPHLAKPEQLETAVDGYPRFERIDAAAVSAASMGLLADRMLRLGRAFPDDQALYLRAPDVTPSPGPKRVTT